MAEFEPAFEFILPNEGGLVDDPADSGGITNFGISLRFLKCVPIERLNKYGIWEEPCRHTIIDLKIETSKNIFRGEFWEAAPFDQINSQRIANYMLDMAVHVSVAQAVKILQRAICATLKTDRIVDDGVLGLKTLKGIDQANNLLLYSLPVERATYYRDLVLKRPKDGRFLNGWIKRCNRI